MKKLLTGVLAIFVGTCAQAENRYDNELALVESWIASQRMYDNVPGLSLAIALDQELAWSGGFGYADIDLKTPAKADTIYGICSISKLFTGIAVMQLRDQGKFQLDDPIASLLPWFNLKQAHDGRPLLPIFQPGFDAGGGNRCSTIRSGLRVLRARSHHRAAGAV